MGFELFLFLALGITAIVAAALMIISENAVHSALFLILNFGSVALLFLMLDAPFISMVQIAVYAGAIMVLFLFVIMLLGAEETSDTSPGFRWLTGAATIAAASFLFALATPLVLGGLDLPEAPGDDPILRVVHAADIAIGDESRPVDVLLTPDGSDEPLTLASGVNFSDVSAFTQVAPGVYTVTIALSDGGNVLYSEVVDLTPGTVASVVANGVFTVEEQTLNLVYMPNSPRDSGQGQARVRVLNVYTENDLILIDEGPDQDLTLNNEGELRDLILADEIPFGVAAEPFSLEETRRLGYTLGIYQVTASGEYIEVAALNDWAVERGTEQNIILVPDYEAPLGLDDTYRARILDRDQDALTFGTAEAFGSPGDIGQRLFTDYLLPVNLVGFLLLVALIGVIMLTRPEGLQKEGRSVRNRRRKVSRPLVSVISQQTGASTAEQPRLDTGSDD